MRSSGFATRWLALVLLCASPLALVVKPVAGQEFSEEITVEEIEIPVHVVRRGSSVAGLKLEDFQVFVDGKPVDIVGFNVLERRAVGEPEASEADREQAVTSTASKRPRHLLVFFDLLFAERHDLLQAVQGARETTSHQLEPEDRVALAYLTSSGVTILVGFTRDRKELELGFDVLEAALKGRTKEVRAGFARLQQHAGDASGDVGDLAGLSQRFGAVAALVFGDQLASGVNLAYLARGVGFGRPAPTLDADRAGVQARIPEDDFRLSPENASVAATTTAQLADELNQFIEATFTQDLAGEIERMAILLRDVPSPKELLYVSHSFSSWILDGGDSSSRGEYLKSLASGAAVRGALGEMHAALLRGGWILHGIDLEGIPAAGPGVGVGSAPGDTFANAPTTSPPGFDAHAIFFMANETGGQVLENYNRVEQATHALLSRTRVTYLLTIQPDDSLASDNRRHSIEVKLRGREPGMRIYHRPAYYADGGGEPSSPLEAQLQTARQWLGDEEDNPLGIVVRAGWMGDAGSANRIGLRMEIPGAVITGRRTAGIVPVEIQVLVLDSQGGVQSTSARGMTVDLAKVGHRLQDRRLCVHAELDVLPGPHRLRTVVHMPTRDETSFLTPAVAERWQGRASDAREQCLDVSL